MCRTPGLPVVKRVRTDVIDREYGKQQWRRTALEVIRRANGICAICRQPGADTAHHKLEKRQGGTDDISNLEAVHRGCHNRAHGRRGVGG